jgi:hypothetical protein
MSDQCRGDKKVGAIFISVLVGHSKPNFSTEHRHSHSHTQMQSVRPVRISLRLLPTYGVIYSRSDVAIWLALSPRASDPSRSAMTIDNDMAALVGFGCKASFYGVSSESTGEKIAHFSLCHTVLFAVLYSSNVQRPNTTCTSNTSMIEHRAIPTRVDARLALLKPWSDNTNRLR